ncbi:hypothetical protein F8M41_001926 [Gigaspora margarita]|uniref:Uncharacterized protein n=1 Tax=Gigaspora margarita TaxID=4874 RepID=A0A8H3XDP2_GIGMA|nr:hypothetical protein F8M41_001926 [Gigaspora margarita]
MEAYNSRALALNILNEPDILASGIRVPELKSCPAVLSTGRLEPHWTSSSSRVPMVPVRNATGTIFSLECIHLIGMTNANQIS